MKHSKFKNTGLLFELLTRQITADNLNEESKSKAMAILQKCFHKKSELFKESQLFSVIIDSKFKDTEKATHLIESTVKAFKGHVNQKKLQREKYELIKQIKENFSINDFLRSRVSNYRLLAAINNVLYQDFSDPVKSSRNHFTVLEHMTRKEEKVEEKTVKTLKKENSDLRALAYKILVDKFNNKYKALLPEQKTVLKEYVNNISNTNTLNEFLESKFTEISYNLKKMLPKINNRVIKIKIKECLNLIANKPVKSANSNNVLKIMRFYQLMEDVKIAIKS